MTQEEILNQLNKCPASEKSARYLTYLPRKKSKGFLIHVII